MASVKFTFRDSRGRAISRTLAHEGTVVADILSDAGTLAGLWNPLTDLAFESVVVSFVDPSGAFAGAAVSNRDEGVSVQVQGGDGRKYDFDLPDMPDAKMPTELLDVTDIDVVAFFDQFNTPNPWRINLNNPTPITALIKGVLDK